MANEKALEGLFIGTAESEAAAVAADLAASEAEDAAKALQASIAKTLSAYESQKAAMLKCFVGKKLPLSDDERARALKAFDSIKQATAQAHDGIRRKVLARAGVPPELVAEVSIVMHTDGNGVPLAVEVIDKEAAEKKIKAERHAFCLMATKDEKPCGVCAGCARDARVKAFKKDQANKAK